MNINPYEKKYPGAGKIPQANPSDGGTGGIGADLTGIQFRDWSKGPILAKITAHGVDNLYSWEQVVVTDYTTGTVSTIPGGLSADYLALPAVEANGDSTVPVDTIVLLHPNQGDDNQLTFVAGIPGAAGASAPTVYAVADLGTTPKTYTVRQVHRNAGGSLVDDAGPVEFTAYEGNNRQALIDTPGTPTREYPLFQDTNGKYYFNIEQYTDGSVSPVLPGQVSTSTQQITGLKKFDSDVEVYNDFTVGYTIATPGGTFAVSIANATSGTFYFGIATPITISYVSNYTGNSYPTNLYGYLSIVGPLTVARPNATPANNSFVTLYSDFGPITDSPPSGGGLLTYNAQPFFSGSPATWAWGQWVTFDAVTRAVQKLTGLGGGGSGDVARYDAPGAFATRDYVGGTDAYVVGDGAGGLINQHFDRGLFIRREMVGAAGGGGGGGIPPGGGGGAGGGGNPGFLNGGGVVNGLGGFFDVPGQQF